MESPICARSLVVCVLLASGAFALENSAQDDVSQRLEQLERENAEMRERLDSLEESSRDEDVDEFAGEGVGLNLVIRNGETRGTVQFFGDVGFMYSDPAARDGRGQAWFFNGSLDLFFTARVGDHFHVLSETVFQTRAGNGAAADGSKFDQERLWGAWAFADELQIKFGLEHSPISLWNRIYHHGRWLEPTIARPLLASFEAGGGILPMHEAGIELLGDIQIGSGSLQYIFFVSNGRGRAPNQVQEFSDQNQDKAITLGAGYRFDAPQTIYIGLFVRTDEIPPDAANGRAASMREWIGSLQGLYRSDSFDIISEVIYILDEDKGTNQEYTSWAGYIQIGYHLNDAWTPYVRIDIRDMETGNPYFAPLNRDLDGEEIVIGMRWDFLDNSALKFELGAGEREERDGGGTVTTNGYVRFGIQLAFVF
jgi:hypothetical protein